MEESQTPLFSLLAAGYIATSYIKGCEITKNFTGANIIFCSTINTSYSTIAEITTLYTATMKIILVAFVLTGLLTISLASPLSTYRESEEREALLQTLLRSFLIGGKKS